MFMRTGVTGGGAACRRACGHAWVVVVVVVCTHAFVYVRGGGGGYLCAAGACAVRTFGLNSMQVHSLRHAAAQVQPPVHSSPTPTRRALPRPARAATTLPPNPKTPLKTPN